MIGGTPLVACWRRCIAVGERTPSITPMATESSGLTPPDGGSPSDQVRLIAAVVVIVGILLVGGLGYVIGTSGSDVTELTGRAAVGDHIASIESGDLFYGVSESVAWIDPTGSLHDDGWPSCLGKAGTTSTVRFGVVAVDIPDVGGMNEVVYVDCRIQ